MAYHRVCSYRNTTGATGGGGTGYPSAASEFTPVHVVRCVLFILTIVLKVILRFTDCDYFFGIYKLFLGTVKYGELYSTQCFYC